MQVTFSATPLSVALRSTPSRARAEPSGTEGGGLHAPAADVAEQVEHALALDVGGQARAVHAVVVEPAGLLPALHRRLELHAVLFQRHPLRHQAEGGLDVAGETLGIARGGVVLEQDAARLEDLHQGLDHRVLGALHGGRGQLHHQVVAEAVHHQARQQVGVAVDQAVEGLVEQALAQAQRNIDPVYQQGLVQHVLDVARQQAGADQVVGAHRHDAERLAAGGFEDGLVARLEQVQRGGDDIDLVAVDPQMAGAQAAVGVGFEAQAGQGHGGLRKKERDYTPPTPTGTCLRAFEREPGKASAAEGAEFTSRK